VRTGALDAPAALAPDVHIFTRSKLPWVGLPPEVPAFEIYYKLSEVWSPESQERRRLALGGPG
jgi:hypothetical protein